MRFRDLFGMALGALFRQKVRTVLTTLGVVFGSVVLVASLSVRSGVHDTVAREAQRFGELRRIHVHPRFVADVSSVPAEVAEIRGKMSEARRQRLREQAIQRWRQQQPARQVKRLDQKALDALAKIPHVHRVEPVLDERCRVSFDNKPQQFANLVTFRHDSDYRERITEGTFLPADGGRCVIVSEDLLYRLGVAGDAALAAVIGKKLHVQFGVFESAPSLAAFQGEPGKATTAEVRALKKVLTAMAKASALMKNLAPTAIAAALKLLERSQKSSAKEPTAITEELTICGVLRLTAQQRNVWRWDQAPENPDLIVAARTAEGLSAVREHGFNTVIVEVERLEDVKPVTKTIVDKLGFNAGSRAEFVEREQFTYRLIFTAMTVVAVVALLVAALGIMNTMLMSVLERVREIGIMKAVGARNSHIQLMFLIEGALIGLVGGLLGLLLSWTATFPGDVWVRSTVESGLSIKLQESIFTFPWWLLVGAPAFACLVTTLAAYYPARRAARIDPVKALRHE